MRSLVRALEKLSVDDPLEAIRQAEVLISHAPLAWIPRLYGVCGSAYRRTADLDRAFHVLFEGITLARQEEDIDAEARLLQRIAHVYGDQGDLEKALATTELATRRYISLGDLRGAGRTLFDQGQWHHYLECFEQTIEICKAAFRLLPRDEIANRFAALQAIGLSHLELGDTRRAIAYARLAGKFRGLVGPTMWSKQLWFEASILSTTGEYGPAEARLHEALGLYLKIGAFLDAALICTEITQLALKAGELGRARRIASSFSKLLVTTPRLADNKIAAGALMDLVRSAATGDHLEQMVTSVRDRLERAQARPRRRG